MENSRYSMSAHVRPEIFRGVETEREFDWVQTHQIRRVGLRQATDRESRTGGCPSVNLGDVKKG